MSEDMVAIPTTLLEARLGDDHTGDALRALAFLDDGDSRIIAQHVTALGYALKYVEVSIASTDKVREALTLLKGALRDE